METNKKIKEINIGEKPNSEDSKKQKNTKGIVVEVIVFIVSIALFCGLTYGSQYLNLIKDQTLERLANCGIYVLFMLITIVALAITKELKVLKITGYKFYMQILWIFIIAILFTFVLGVLPVLLNLDSYTPIEFNLDNFIYKMIFDILFVGIGEEMFFRGYIMNQLMKWLKKFDYFAPLIAGIMFGLLHLINGSIAQAIITSLMGVCFGYLKYYFKSCTLLSVSLGHGLYDFLLYCVDFIQF